MNATRKVKLKDIASNLTCHLCLGYFIDATTIIECLHSFCKSCIVKHLEKSEYCPVCDVQLHSTKPLSSIRSDQMLQEIVYKLVPGLFRKEMSRRREFYEKQPESSTTSQMDSGQVFNELYITSDDIIHVSLEYFTDDPMLKEKTTRYLKCPAAVSISILKKLVQGKFELRSDLEIDIMYGERNLPDEFLVMDIAYKYSWTNNGNKPLQLSYRVKGISQPAVTNFKSTKLSTPVYVKTPTSLKRRRSRASADSDVTRTEILKSSNRNLPVDTDSQIPISTVTPKLTPNGKGRGRRKRSLNEDGNNIPVENKKKKPGKNTPVKDYRESECQSEPTISKSSEPVHSMEKEVQLRISENGVISAKSVFSGEEKIIGSLLKSPSKSNGPSNASEKPELRNGISSINEKSTNVSDITNVNSVTSKHNPGPMHPLLISNSIGATSRPNYVKLNIPTVTTTSLSHSPPNNSNPKLLANGNVNGSPCAKLSTASPQKLTPVKRKLVDKGSTGNSPSGKMANANEFEDKQANVKKALIDLEKKLYTSISKGSLSKLPGMLGISSSNNQQAQGESEGLPILNNGSHSVSVSQPSQPHLNGTNLQNTFSFPLSFGSSGMTVNLISSTTNCQSAMGSITTPISNSPPQKKPAHHTTVVNGDLKFTSSPRHILPFPSKEILPTGPVSLSPKKPPKFFKSRHSSAVISGTTSTSSDSESPVKKESSTKNISTSGIVDYNFSFASTSTPTPTASKSSPCNIGANTITTPSGMGSSHLHNQASRLQPQISNSFHPMNLQLNQLQMSLAATSSANNIPMTLVPFVTSNYCSMPFMNSRSPFSMNMNLSSHLPTFPFAYPGMSSPSFTQSYTPGTTLNGSMNGGPHLSVPISYTSSQSTDSGKNNGHQFLDLSMNKNKINGRNGNSDPPQDKPLSLKKPVSPKNATSSAPPKVWEKSGNQNPTSVSKMNGPISLVIKDKPTSELDKRGNDPKAKIVDCDSNGNGIKDGTKKVKEIKTVLEIKTSTAEVQAPSKGNGIGDNNTMNDTKISAAMNSDDNVSKKLQNGHPNYSYSKADKILSTIENSKPYKACHVPKEDVRVNQDVPEINNKSAYPESHQNLPNGQNGPKPNPVLEIPSMSKDQVPSCNNNNGPPEISQTSSTTGA